MGIRIKKRASCGRNGVEWPGGWVDVNRRVERCCESLFLKEVMAPYLGREERGKELARALLLRRCRYLGPPGVVAAYILQQGEKYRLRFLPRLLGGPACNLQDWTSLGSYFR